MIIAERIPARMPLNAVHFSVFPKTMGDLIKQKGLKVPPSQRSYRWQEEHVQDLFRDILAAIDEEEYFLGSVISIETGGKIMIYDGQQRIATTMILIAAMRDHFVDSGNVDDAETIERELLISKRRGGAEPDAHFELNSKDHGFFLERVLLRKTDSRRMGLPKASKIHRDSHKRIEGAAAHAAEFVGTLVANRTAADAQKQLHRWLDFIEKALTVVWVQVADERTAFTVFETMNDRGLKLSAADLLKNYLHATAPASRRDEVIQKWDGMCSVLETIDGEEENVVEFVRCFWVTRHGHTRTRSLFDRMKEQTTNAAKAVTLVSDLEKQVQDYAAIILSSHERLADRGNTVKMHIANLRTLGVTQVRPVLLAAFSKFKHGEFEKLLARTVAWSVRFLIKGVPSGTLERHYARNAQQIWDGTLAKSKDVEADMNKVVPADDVFEAAFASASVTSSQIARYYLQVLQEQKDGTADPDYTPSNRSNITLEHILPGKPEDKVWDHFTPEEQKAYVNRIGNLALLQAKGNGKIGSKSYTLKKSVLANETEFSLTKETGAHTAWTKAEIETRQAALAKLAIKAWPLS